MFQLTAILGLLSVPVVSEEWGMGLRVFRNSTELAERVQQNAELLHNYIEANSSGQNVAFSCYGDMTHSMPACLQNCGMWCWITVATIAGNYYKGENECDNWECSMATHFLLNREDWEWPKPDSCCPAADHCHAKEGCNVGGGGDRVVKELSYFTGGSFAEYGPLSQSDLDNALNSGRVVMMSVSWAPVGHMGGHWLMIGGCGDGYYYVHDPYQWYDQMQSENPPAWQGLTYDQVLRYPSPGVYRTDGGENVGIWDGTVMWSWDDADNHAQAVMRANAKRGLWQNAALV